MSLPYNRRAVLVFLASIGLALTLLIVALVIYDIVLYSGPEAGGATISWGMAVLGHDQPIIPFLWGLAVASVFWLGIALAVHFWWGVERPADVEEIARLRARVAELEAELRSEINGQGA